MTPGTLRAYLQALEGVNTFKGLEVEILDGEILAIGDDDLPRRPRIIEAEAAWPLHVELALHALVVGARLHEAALQRRQPAEVAADLVDELSLLRIEADAIAGLGGGNLGTPRGSRTLRRRWLRRHRRRGCDRSLGGSVLLV